MAEQQAVGISMLMSGDLELDRQDTKDGGLLLDIRWPTSSDTLLDFLTIFTLYFASLATMADSRQESFKLVCWANYILIGISSQQLTRIQ